MPATLSLLGIEVVSSMVSLVIAKIAKLLRCLHQLVCSLSVDKQLLHISLISSHTIPLGCMQHRGVRNLVRSTGWKSEIKH